MRISDWSSDVCSADLALAGGLATVPVTTLEAVAAAVGADEFGGRAPLLVVLDAKRSDLYGQWFDADGLPLTPPLAAPVEVLTSEERREGKRGVSSGQSRWSTLTLKKNKVDNEK